MAIRKVGRRSPPPAADLTDEEGYGDTVLPKPRPTLAVALATHMLRHAVGGASWLREDGCAVAVAVPSAAWVKSASQAMHLLVAEARDHELDEVRVQTVERLGAIVEDCDSIYYEVIKEGSKKYTVAADADDIAEILSNGKSLIIFYTSSELLPPKLVGSLDHRVDVPRPNWECLSLSISDCLGSVPSETLENLLCGKIEPDDLMLAIRPNQTADQFVVRLRRLLQPSVLSTEDNIPVLGEVHGMHDAVAWGQVLARDLADYTSGKLDWRDVDRGVLLVGRPGTGKTTYAKSLVKTLSVACNKDVALVAASYSKWQSSGHLGDFLKAMRADFAFASTCVPSVLFVDELDSFLDRDKVTSDNADYNRQTVNGLLESIDGVSGRQGVVLLGATNNVDIIDKALLRPGRFDKIIRISLPDANALMGIFRQHLGCDVGDLSDVARLAVGASGAMVEQWSREARRIARYECRQVSLHDLKSVVTQAIGPTRSDESMRVAAVHEAGHAYLTAVEAPESLGFVTVRDRGAVSGLTVYKSDDCPVGIEDVKFLLRKSLAGRAAEFVLLRRVSDGAGGHKLSDLSRATKLATEAVLDYCLVDEVPRWYIGMGNESFLLHNRPDIARQVDELLSVAWATAVDTIKAGRNSVKAIADALLKNETLTADSVLSIINRKTKMPSQADTDAPEEDEQEFQC